ncbi:MAG: EAL domain-containing protein [Aquisalimonadaceae bacterium]
MSNDLSQEGVLVKQGPEKAENSGSLSQFAIDNAADGAVWLRRDGTHYYVNKAICRLLGYSREELMSLTVFDVNPQFTAENWAEHWEALKQAGSFTNEGRLQGKDGRVALVEISANFLVFAGEEYNCASIRDVTGRKHAEELLHRSGMLLRIAGQTARIGGWAVDLAEGRILWSDEVCAIHELPKGTAPSLEEGIGFYAPEWRDRLRAVFDACARHGTPYDEEMEIITAKGRRIWVRSMGEALRDDCGTITQVRGAFQDITEQKRVARTLDQSRRRFRELADAMPMIVWTADADGELDFANRALDDYTGITEADLPRSGWLQAVHPDDKDSCLAAWGESVRTGKEYMVEFRVRNRANGKYRWHLVRAVPIRDEAGTIVKWYGTATDIHDQKTTEEELSRLASRLANTLESITDAFYTLDQNWRFTYINKEAERIFGRDRTDMLGKVIWEEFPELHETRIYKEYQRAVDEVRTVQFEERSPSFGVWLEIHGYPSEEGLAVYFRDISGRKQAEEDIQFFALYDPLTRLPNRRLLQDRLQQALVAATRNRLNGAVLFLDLDNFKTLNDTLGHDEGDLLLQQVADRLTIGLRESDTVGRFGGDEFVVILGELDASAEQAALKAERIGKTILAALNQPYRLGGYQRQITPSIGITMFGQQGDSANELMKRADFAMYQAKAGGRNTLRMFDPAMQATVNRRVELEADMREGLQRREFVPYYQPQVDDTGRLTGAEALARWQHAERGLISPAEFIPVAEETGLILPLGRHMLEAVCTQLAVWADRPDTADLSLAVNISARQFHHPDFVDGVLEVIDQTGANPERLKLELTESLLLEDVEDAITKMTALKDCGVRFSLDDFGTGYSSLYYLKRLPLEKLKIDQRFVRDVLTDAIDAAIVRTVIVLAQSLGLGVIAEGVETVQVRDFLGHHGCAHYQGFLFGYPEPIEQFEARMRDRQGDADLLMRPGE